MPEPLTAPATVPVFYASIPDIPDGPAFEIAWATLAFETYGVICQSRLIRPPPARVPTLVRDSCALKAYGLKLSDRRLFGMPTHELVARMNETLAGRELFSLRGCLETNFMISRAFRGSASLAIRPRPRKTEQSQVQYKRAGPNFL